MLPNSFWLLPGLEIPRLRLYGSFLFEWEPNDIISLEVPATKIAILPLAPLLQYTPDILPGSNFETAFPYLAKLPEQYQLIPIGDLKSVLEAGAFNNKQEVELFGAKIPSALIFSFGLPGLAILLFQFGAVCSYAIRGSKHVEIEDASEWSFLLNGKILTILRYGTTLVLPVVAAILSALCTPPDPSLWWLWWILVIITVSGAAFASVNLARLRELVLLAERPTETKEFAS